MLLLLLLLFVLLLSLLFLLFLVIKVEQQKNNKVERGKSKTQFPSQKMVPLSQNPNNKENPAIKQGQAAGERYASTPCDLTHLGLTAGGPFIQKQTRLRFPKWTSHVAVCKKQILLQESEPRRGQRWKWGESPWWSSLFVASLLFKVWLLRSCTLEPSAVMVIGACCHKFAQGIVDVSWLGWTTLVSSTVGVRSGCSPAFANLPHTSPYFNDPTWKERRWIRYEIN